MAFLNMEQQTWAFTFGILGTYCTLSFFLDQLCIACFPRIP